MPKIQSNTSISNSLNVNVEILPRVVDLGGFEVRRILPCIEKKTVGPFVFWDQAGPGEFIRGHGIDVRPHPHICLSTMTYLFKGRLQHRDSIGSNRIITPGDVNLMTAGRGIAHSERTPEIDRLHNHPIFGIQTWLAIPINKEEINPKFTHYSKEQLPRIVEKNLEISLVAGEWMGLKSPVDTLIDTLFVECKLKEHAELNIPATTEERAIHILSGSVKLDNYDYGNQRMLILKPNSEIKVTATDEAHIILLGGSPLEEPRHLWWNFVASSKDRIEQAKLDWSEGKFGEIPGDDQEFIPLPN